MNGFLVLLVRTTDDLPIRLCATEVEAKAVAAQTKEMPTAAIREVLETGDSTPLCVKIVEFHDGKPVKVSVVKDFDR